MLEYWNNGFTTPHHFVEKVVESWDILRYGQIVKNDTNVPEDNQ